MKAALLVLTLVACLHAGTAKMSQSQVRQNFHGESEKAINDQINMFLYASYAYQAAAHFFDREDVALKGFSKAFREGSTEERDKAQKLMNYQNMRGGRVEFKDVKAPPAEYDSGLAAMEAALQLERDVNDSLLKLHNVADSHGDAQMIDFLEGEYLAEQVEEIKEIGEFITKLKRAGPGLGEYTFDKELQ